VIGAGAAGLAATQSLVKAGRSVKVLEAQDRVGGRVHSVQLEDGHIYERGGQFFSRHMHELLGLAKRYGFHHRVIRATPGGLAMIDAPVSGGTGGAIAGTLTFIVGGESADLERARPLLERMGKNIFHAGAAGAGQVAKIANNMLLGIAMAGTAEALALGVANGLDPKVLSEIISKSSGRTWAIELYNPWPGVMENVPSSKGYAGGFGVDLMLKDLGLAAEAAVSTQSVIALGELARNLFAMHSAQGSGKLDFSSIVNLVKRGE
jgi:3-hydroxyisobutyrate dehydrogenase